MIESDSLIKIFLNGFLKEVGQILSVFLFPDEVDREKLQSRFGVITLELGGGVNSKIQGKAFISPGFYYVLGNSEVCPVRLQIADRIDPGLFPAYQLFIHTILLSCLKEIFV